MNSSCSQLDQERTGSPPFLRFFRRLWIMSSRKQSSHATNVRLLRACQRPAYHLDSAGLCLPKVSSLHRDRCTCPAYFSYSAVVGDVGAYAHRSLGLRCCRAWNRPRAHLESQVVGWQEGLQRTIRTALRPQTPTNEGPCIGSALCRAQRSLEYQPCRQIFRS